MSVTAIDFDTIDQEILALIVAGITVEDAVEEVVNNLTLDDLRGIVTPIFVQRADSLRRQVRQEQEYGVPARTQGYDSNGTPGDSSARKVKHEVNKTIAEVLDEVLKASTVGQRKAAYGLLGKHSFPLDGRLIPYLDATIAEHEARIKKVKPIRDSADREMKVHQLMVADIKTRKVTTLRGI